MRPQRLALILIPLLLAVPPAPAHDGSVQWDLPCSTTEPMSPSLAVLATQTFGYTPGELAFSGNDLFVSRWTSGGFQIYDISDPAAPRLRSTIGTSGTALDVKVSPDGTTAFVGTSGRIWIVDITNRDAPKVLRSEPFTTNQEQGHMLYPTEIDGEQYLLSASQMGTGVHIFRITGTGTSRDLTRVAIFAPGSPLAAHDMYVQHDPVLGIPVLYVANGFLGWLAADLSNPALPVPLAVVPNPDAGQQYLHTVQASWIDGRRIVVTIAELGGNLMRVWDATILSAPLLLAEWSTQTDLGFIPSVSSQHNIQIVDGRLFMAHYRCGFWVFDLRGLGALPVPQAIAPTDHFAVQHPSGQHWDVVVKDGVIYTSDMRMQTGGAFYSVTYIGLTRGAAAQTSTG